MKRKAQDCSFKMRKQVKTETNQKQAKHNQKNGTCKTKGQTVLS